MRHDWEKDTTNHRDLYPCQSIDSSGPCRALTDGARGYMKSREILSGRTLPIYMLVSVCR